MKINKTVQYIGGFILVALFFLFQYGGEFFQGSGEKGDTVTFEALMDLHKQTESDGKRIALIGHASGSNVDINRRIGAPLSLTFYNPDESHVIYLPFPFGKEEENSCYLPNSFTPEDLVLYDNEGNIHSYNEDVIVSFTLERITNSIPEKDPKTGDYAWRYKQLRIDKVE